MNSNLDEIFSGVTDTLTGGVSTDVMTVVMSLIVLFIILAAFLWIKEVLLNASGESPERKERSRHEDMEEFREEENSNDQIRH